MRVLHVINSLEVGGAERFLLRLIPELVELGVESTILPLQPGGALEPIARSNGIKVTDQGRFDKRTLTGVGNFRRFIRRDQPDLVQGWLYAGNLAASILSLLTLGAAPLVWNFRHTITDLADESRTTRASLKLLRLLSRYPKLVLHNSLNGQASHHEWLSRCRSQMVIPNGFDVDEFRLDESTRKNVRIREGWSETDVVVMVVGRHHPMKGQAEFLRTVGAVGDRCPNLRVVVVGRGADSSSQDLLIAARESGLAGSRVNLLGARTDVADLLAAADVFVLPSLWGEGFPNVVGEAMSSGLPCVVTDVGAAAELVGSCGLVVPPGEPAALGGAIAEMVAMGDADRDALGRRARERIESSFTLSQVAAQYAQVWRDVRQT